MLAVPFGTPQAYRILGDSGSHSDLRGFTGRGHARARDCSLPGDRAALLKSENCPQR